MSNLQTIKEVAKANGLNFVCTNSTINGAQLYNFVNEFGQVVASNWTITSAINEYHFGNLESKIK